MDLLAPSEGGPDGDLEPVSFPQCLANAREVLGEPAIAWAVQQAKWIVDTATERVDGAGTSLDVDRRSCETALLAALVTLRTGQVRMDILSEAVEVVRGAVRRGVRLEVTMRAIWIGHTSAQTALFEVLYRHLPADRLVDELRTVSDGMLSFVDRLTSGVTTLYERERAAWEDRLTTTRRQALKHVLERGTAPEGGEELLGIRLSGHHLAGVVRPVAHGAASDWDSGVARFAAQVATVTGASGSLVLPWPDDVTVVVWSFATVPEDPLTAIRNRVPRPDRAIVALGAVCTGVAGLQQSLRGAWQASRVADHARTDGVWAYDEVGLQALLLADPEAAACFVQHVLRGLAETDAKSQVLRETLWAYLRHGRSRQAASQQLHVAPNTVAYRVAQAEQRLSKTALADPAAVVAAISLARDFPQLLG
jgi:PucR C-terminal helix-turn-helix domain/GGDEF-like domain